MISRVMLDTGALIALERRHLRICKIHRMAIASGLDVVSPTPVIAEWWRSGRGESERRRLLRTLLQEPPDGHVARLAGSAIGRVGASVVDALVMAAASIRSDTVYTSDVDDLERLLEIFPGVRVEPVCSGIRLGIGRVALDPLDATRLQSASRLLSSDPSIKGRACGPGKYRLETRYRS